MQPEASLYIIFNRLIGRQFFKNCLGFPAFGIQVIMLNLFELGNCSCLYESLIARVTKIPISFQKNFKNLQLKPSGPGLLSFFHFFKEN